MLDRSKLLKQIETVIDSLFLDLSKEHTLAQQVWDQIIQDPTFLHQVKKVNAPWPVPFWRDELKKTYRVEPIKKYTAISVDGSQIYPDRHQGVACFLINIGTIVLHYATHQPPVLLETQPYIFSGQEFSQQEFNTELVNCKRQELELKNGYEKAKAVIKQLPPNTPALLLYDGSLIFWHLEAKETNLREQFLSTYLASLQQLFQEKIITASYISMPKSRELINLIRLYLCNFDTTNKEAFEPMERIVDTAIAYHTLDPYERTIVFQNNSNISDYYPDHLRPHFFYLHVGTEIGRVEIPAWIAQDETKVNLVAQVVLDQCKKGRGYPVVLAEAHEQAVVKGPDREFFYHVLTKFGIERKQKWHASQKSIKKRGIGI